MRWNEPEVTQLACQSPEWEGRLNYKPPAKSRGPFGGASSEPRTRWFRLRANFLFFYKLNLEDRRPATGSEPLGVLVLERFHVQKDSFENANAFSILFEDEPGKKHYFIADNHRSALQWEAALKKASYQKLREELLNLQIKLKNKTGVDPLLGSMFSSGPTVVAGVIPQPKKIKDSDPPSPKPRKKKAKPGATFQSHMFEQWDKHSPLADLGILSVEDDNFETVEVNKSIKKKASFKSHVEVPIGNLLDL